MRAPRSLIASSPEPRRSLGDLDSWQYTRATVRAGEIEYRKTRAIESSRLHRYERNRRARLCVDTIASPLTGSLGMLPYQLPRLRPARGPLPQVESHVPVEYAVWLGPDPWRTAMRQAFWTAERPRLGQLNSVCSAADHGPNLTHAAAYHVRDVRRVYGVAGFK